MPTIRQMYSGVYGLYKTQYANGQLFRSTPNSAAQKNSAAWNNSVNVSGISSNARDLLKSYNTTKQTFDSEFSETISALQTSAKKIKSFDFNVGEDAVTKTETVNADGEKVTQTKYSDKLTDALKAVENFLSDYNDAINFFNDNSSVSARVSRLANTFADTTYYAKNYAQIGVEVGSGGTMKIDEDKLVDAITKNPGKVSRLLGSDGLAKKADRHISTAQAQSANLFPTARAMLGSSFSAANFYGSSGYLRSNSYAGLGNLISMMF